MTITTCNPLEWLKSKPCLSCLSETELLAVIVVALAEQAGYSIPAQVGVLLKDSACAVSMSKKQMLQSITTMALNLSLNTLTVTQLRNRIQHLGNNPKQLQAALTFLLCITTNQKIMNMNLLASGVAQLSGGTVTVLNSNASPTNAILLSYFSIDGNSASVSYGNVVTGVSFTITSSNSFDSNLASWAILNP